MRSIKRILMILFVINLCMLVLQINKVQAITMSELEDDASSFISAGEGKSGELNSVIKSVTGEFIGLGRILTTIGAGIMVAVTSYMGIKYIVSPPDKQAALKQQLIGLVVSGIVIFGAYGIWSAVVTVASNFD